MTPEECRVARLSLNLSADTLAQFAGLTRRTVLDFEEGARRPRAGTLIALRRALRAAGVELQDGA